MAKAHVLRVEPPSHLLPVPSKSTTSTPKHPKTLDTLVVLEADKGSFAEWARKTLQDCSKPAQN